MLLAAFAASETVSYYTGSAQSSWNRRMPASVDYSSHSSSAVPFSTLPLRAGRRPRLSGGLHSTATRDEAVSTAGVGSTEGDLSASSSSETSNRAGEQDNGENSFTQIGSSRTGTASNGGGGGASGGRQKFVGTKAAKAVRASESLSWTLQRMGEAPLLTAAQELDLGARCLALGEQVEARRAAAASLGREPSGLEWAVAANFTGAKSALMALQRCAAAAAAASVAHDDNGDVDAAAARAAAVRAANQARLKADAVAVAFAVDHASNRAAKEELLNANMRLVVSIARRYQNLGVSLQDLVQEGCLGLIRAAEKYDPARGFRFATYASWYGACLVTCLDLGFYRKK